MIKDFTDLEIWQLACKLIIKIYELTKDFPAKETYGLISQIKNAIISVAANIAEGFGRFYFKDRVKFYYNSRGSLAEVKSHLLVAEKLGFIKNKTLYLEILEEIEKNKQVILRYCDKYGNISEYPYNPNGSVNNIAGICSKDGLIVGMMPHPERSILKYYYPDFLREVDGDIFTPSFQIFKNMVKYFS